MYNNLFHKQKKMCFEFYLHVHICVSKNAVVVVTQNDVFFGCSVVMTQTLAGLL